MVRPLRALADQGVEVVKVAAGPDGFVAPADLRQACTPGTRMLVMTHCSNVTGTVQAIEELGPWCRAQGILFLVDAAQSAGLFPIDVTAMAIDLLAVPGHKAIMGPPGTGFLCVGEGVTAQAAALRRHGDALHLRCPARGAAGAAGKRHPERGRPGGVARGP